MTNLTPSTLEFVCQKARAVVDMAATLRRDGTPLGAALQQAENRLRALELPAGLPDAAVEAARREQGMMLDLIRRARVEPDLACSGQDPIDWLSMVIEDRARQIAPEA